MISFLLDKTRSTPRAFESLFEDEFTRGKLRYSRTFFSLLKMVKFIFWRFLEGTRFEKKTGLVSHAAKRFASWVVKPICSCAFSRLAL